MEPPLQADLGILSFQYRPSMNEASVGEGGLGVTKDCVPGFSGMIISELFGFHRQQGFDRSAGRATEVGGRSVTSYLKTRHSAGEAPDSQIARFPRIRSLSFSKSGFCWGSGMRGSCSPEEFLLARRSLRICHLKPGGDLAASVRHNQIWDHSGNISDTEPELGIDQLPA